MSELPKKTRRKPAANKEHLSIALDVQPKTFPQRQMIEAFVQGKNVVAYGSAGSGKSFIACNLALQSFFNGEKDKIVIVRSAVPTRDQGFLPGTLEEKSAAYTIPYKQIVNDLCQNGTAWDILTKKGLIEFVTTSYIRGITINNATVIVDEVQSCNAHEISSIITRMGENSQIILCGDTAQNDLIKSKHDVSGFEKALEAFRRLPDWFELCHFTTRDIVRSGLVRAWIETWEEL